MGLPKVFADLNRGRMPYQDWLAYAKQLGATIFKNEGGVEEASRADGVSVGKWNHNSYLGWVRSNQEMVERPNE